MISHLQGRDDRGGYEEVAPDFWNCEQVLQSIPRRHLNPWHLTAVAASNCLNYCTTRFPGCVASAMEDVNGAIITNHTKGLTAAVCYDREHRIAVARTI